MRLRLKAARKRKLCLLRDLLAIPTARQHSQQLYLTARLCGAASTTKEAVVHPSAVSVWT